MRSFVLILCAGALAGCASGPYDRYDRYGRIPPAVHHPGDPYQGGPYQGGPYHDSRYQPAFGPGAPWTAPRRRDVCEVGALTERRQAMLNEAYAYRSRLAASHGGAADYDTSVLEMLTTFETDVDAAYRFGVASCRIYSECLEYNGYQEGACAATQTEWGRSRLEFQTLSTRLAAIRENVTAQCLDCWPRGGRAHGVTYDRHPDYGYSRGHGYSYSHGRRDRRYYRSYRNDDVVGSIFRTRR